LVAVAGFFVRRTEVEAYDYFGLYVVRAALPALATSRFGLAKKFHALVPA
jgi:hypothetical protein